MSFLGLSAAIWQRLSLAHSHLWQFKCWQGNLTWVTLSNHHLIHLGYPNSWCSAIKIGPPRLTCLWLWAYKYCNNHYCPIATSYLSKFIEFSGAVKHVKLSMYLSIKLLVYVCAREYIVNNDEPWLLSVSSILHTDQSLKCINPHFTTCLHGRSNVMFRFMTRLI